MLTVLHHISRARLRLCKNRTSLHFALKHAKHSNSHPILLTAIHDCQIRTNQLIQQHDVILDTLGRTPGPTQP